MTITKQLLLTELGYTVWAGEVVLTACSDPSSLELHRDLGASHDSIVRTLATSAIPSASGPTT